MPRLAGTARQPRGRAGELTRSISGFALLCTAQLIPTELDMSQAAGSSSPREEEPSSAEFSTLGLTPSQQTQQLAGASFTKFNPALLLCSNNSRSISARHEMTYCAALGRPVSPLRGVVTWEVRIDNSRQNQGGAMCIGVADASATFTDGIGGSDWCELYASTDVVKGRWTPTTIGAYEAFLKSRDPRARVAANTRDL